MANTYDLTLHDYIKAFPDDPLVAKGIEESVSNTDENTEKIEENTSTIEQLKSDVDQLEQQVTVIEGQIQTLQGQVGQLQTDVTNLQNDVTTLKADVLDLQTRMTQAEADISQLKLEVQNLQIDVNKLKQDLTNLTGRVSANEQSISNIEIELNNIDQDIAELKDQKSSYQSQTTAITIPASGSIDVFTYTTVANGLHGITAICDTIDADVTLNITANAVNAFGLVLTERTTTPQIPVNITTPIDIVLTLTNSSATAKNVSPFVALSVLRF